MMQNAGDAGRTGSIGSEYGYAHSVVSVIYSNPVSGNRQPSAARPDAGARLDAAFRGQ